MFRKFSLLFFITLISVLFVNKNLFSQDKWWKEKKYKDESSRLKYDLCKKTFKDIGIGLQYRNVNNINPYFDTQVYLNIVNNEKGYYSSSQAELILQDFMDDFPVRSFKYLRSSRFNTYAFVNGVYNYSNGTGNRNLKVAVSLKYYNNNWYIDQIGIN